MISFLVYWFFIGFVVSIVRFVFKIMDQGRRFLDDLSWTQLVILLLIIGPFSIINLTLYLIFHTIRFIIKLCTVYWDKLGEIGER